MTDGIWPRVTDTANRWLSCRWTDMTHHTRHLITATHHVYTSGQISTSLADGVINMRRYMNVRDASSLAVGWAAGAAAFYVTFAGAVRAARVARLSSAQRKLAGMVGVIAVPTCGIIAGHTMQFVSAEFSARVHHQYASPLLQRSHSSSSSTSSLSPSLLSTRTRDLPGAQWQQHSITAYENAFYGVTSLLLFRLAGGRLRFVAPSDIAKAGSFATKSLPARYNTLCDAGEKAKLRLIGTITTMLFIIVIMHGIIGMHDGCHHCGTRYGIAFWRRGAGIDWIGDHIPPNKYATHNGPTQRFYPQCNECSLVQSVAVRGDQRTLMLPNTIRAYHFWWPLPMLWLGLVPLTYAIHHQYERQIANAASSSKSSSSASASSTSSHTKASTSSHKPSHK